MNKDRDIIIKAISRAIEEILIMKEYMKRNKKNIEEIKNIIYKLNEMESALITKKKWFNEKINSLVLLLKELSEFRFKVILESVDEMFDSIEINLIDWMSLNKINKNTF